MLREDLQAALKQAMLARDADTTGAVRLIIAGMKDKDVEARGKGQGQATEAELLSMIQGMVKQRNESIKIYVDASRQDLADKEQKEIVIIEKFLPKQMSDAEVEVVIKEIISATGAAGIKDMGKVMSELKANYAGKLDFGKASGAIKALLQ